MITPIIAAATDPAVYPARESFTHIALMPWLIYIILLLGIIWFIRFLVRGANERKRLRLEIGKLAEEVHNLRQEKESKEEI